MSWAEVKAGQVVRILNGAQAVEKDGIKHSANIFTNWTKQQLKNIGYYPYRVVKEQADSRFYSIGSTSHTITNDNTEVVGTVKAIAKDIAEIKKGYLNVVNQRAYGLLHPTDWQVVKAKELGTNFPETYIVQTPRGYHHYYLYDSSIQTSAGRVEKCDIRIGGFVRK